MFDFCFNLILYNVQPKSARSVLDERPQNRALFLARVKDFLFSTAFGQSLRHANPHIESVLEFFPEG
jgi:hypothetical protein